MVVLVEEEELVGFLAVGTARAEVGRSVRRMVRCMVDGASVRGGGVLGLMVWTAQDV